MSKKLPPLNPLKVFDAVVRTQNLTKAAQELHISQSAVSKQLNVLQTYLGVELFRRERHGISLTHSGQRYAEAINPAFDLLSKATEDLMRSGSDSTLRIQTYTTFAAKWLIPRLSDFNSKHPDITVKITNSVSYVDFDRDNVDLAIQIGNGAWPRQDSDFLFEDVIEPVCSPDFLRQYAPDARYPQALLRVRLLVSHFRPHDWRTWAKLCRYETEIEPTEQMRFSSSILTWQAAADSLGVAIGQTTLLVDDLKKQKLVAPFNLPVKTGLSYYLVRPQLQRHSRKVEIFRSWIAGQLELLKNPS
ncbi:LysR substrate-binding domain-containing protein [Comamonas sp. NoAH]|uniref:LysR substrate-binding domain-containing protein n=1 Tax=Comamonas halotolerans TaxID=3041496 RepID=UPI0024E132E6|nr:LysR substrate-binding domain-containing protein [Comamonas sp. NoAH]